VVRGPPSAPFSGSGPPPFRFVLPTPGGGFYEISEKNAEIFPKTDFSEKNFKQKWGILFELLTNNGMCGIILVGKYARKGKSRGCW
jgi:hypothetical protein